MNKKKKEKSGNILHKGKHKYFSPIPSPPPPKSPPIPLKITSLLPPPPHIQRFLNYSFSIFFNLCIYIFSQYFFPFPSTVHFNSFLSFSFSFFQYNTRGWTKLFQMSCSFSFIFPPIFFSFFRSMQMNFFVCLSVCLSWCKFLC